MIVPNRITEWTTLRELADLCMAFGLMITAKPITGARSEATASDGDGVIGTGAGATLADAIREAAIDFVTLRQTYDTGRKVKP